MNNFRRE